MEAAEKALWFIESHYSEELSLRSIAEVAGVAVSSDDRPLGGGRRLTETAHRLARGAPDIL